MELIEINQWKRRGYFYMYMREESPLRNGTAILDCTRVYDCARKSRIPFPVVMLHALLSAVNRTESFRIRLVTEDYVARYDTINLYTLELDREHLYHTALTGYSPSLRRFYENYMKSRREARRTDENKQPVPSLLNTITVSYLPGIRFTQIYERPISAAANKRGCLHLLVGKMEYENGRATVPVSIIFSHALLDGYDLEKGIAYITEKYGTEETEE